MSERKLTMTTPPIDFEGTCDLVRAFLKENDIPHIEAVLAAVSMVNTLIEIINGNGLVADMLQIFEGLPAMVRNQYSCIIQLNKMIRKFNSIGPILEKKHPDKFLEEDQKFMDFVQEITEILQRISNMIQEREKLRQESAAFSRVLVCPDSGLKFTIEVKMVAERQDA